MAGATYNWNAINAKIKNGISKKIDEKMSKEIPMICSEFESIMDFEIADNPGLTIGESERLSDVKFQRTGSTFIAHDSTGNNVTATYRIGFDFVGDKTLVSLSPGKSVYNLVALFNNGYASNNVRPDAPIRGIWHGVEIVIRPRSRHGAHFISNAVQKFKEWCAAYYHEYNIDLTVSSIYH